MFDGTVTMEDFGKFEVPEVTEFDVYLDIDGAEEEEVTAPAQLLHNEKTAVAGVPWQSDVPRPGLSSSDFTSGVQQGVRPVASTDTHSPHADKSDEDEIDIDTPYDGKLMGQTQPKVSNPQSLLTRLIRYVRESNSLPNDAKAPKKSVARKSTALQSSKMKVTKNVAVKSTTPRKPGNKSVSNVARKSTAKQSRPAASGAGPKLVPVKPDTNLLQVKFDREKSRHRSLPNILSKSGNKKNHGTSAVSVSIKTSPGSLANSQIPSKIFTCNEKSGGNIACPMCSLVMKQLSLRSHLRNKHNMSMHICKRCRLTFTDVDQYSEHYALHLQQEEDRNAGIHSSLLQLHVAPRSEEAVPVQSQLPPKANKPLVTKKQLSPAREATFSRPSSDIPDVSSEAASLFQSKLPLKAGKYPSKNSVQPLPSDAKGPSSSFNRRSSSPSGTSGINFPVQPKLPPKPRKPSPLKKRRSSPVTIRRPSPSSSSVSSESQRTRRTSTASLQSEASSSSDIGETNRPTSPHYKKKEKTAFRRGQRSISPIDIQPTKRQRLDKDAAAVVSRKLCNKEVCSEGIFWGDGGRVACVRGLLNFRQTLLVENYPYFHVHVHNWRNFYIKLHDFAN